MKIAIDAREMAGPLAGKGRYVAEIVKALAAIDRRNQYLIYSKVKLTEKLPSNFEPVIIGGLPGTRQLWLANDIKRRRADLLFAPTGYLPAILSRVPTIVAVHDLAIFVCPPARPALKTLIAERLLLGIAVKNATKIVAVSQSTKNDLIRQFGLPAEKIKVTLLGYDQAAMKPAKSAADSKVLAKYGIPPGYLLFVGTLEPRKNIEGLLRAYASLTPDERAATPLVIAGKKGWHYAGIFNLATDLGLTNSVKFIGRVPDADLPALYRQATIFLFPSFYEGFGLPPLEAMACGTPVIASRNSSLIEVVGEGGLLVETGSTAALSQAIRQLLSDDRQRAKLAAAGLEQAAKFSWQTAAKQTLALFEESAPGG